LNKSCVKKEGTLFVISGPSGSGKTTLAEKLLHDAALKRVLIKSISVTTRNKRRGERQGRDYFFISQGRFLALRKAKKILEWTSYLGYYYGTPKEFVDTRLAEGKSIILCLDVRGARRIKRMYRTRSVTVFIKPPSVAVLRQRIESRGRETRPGEIDRRLVQALQELGQARQYDYQLVNDKLSIAVAELKAFVLQRLAERSAADCNPQICSAKQKHIPHVVPSF